MGKHVGLAPYDNAQNSHDPGADHQSLLGMAWKRQYCSGVFVDNSILVSIHGLDFRESVFSEKVSPREAL
jgi:hypothetical protein